eukprot:5276553-Amphidinium_carterae.3
MDLHTATSLAHGDTTEITLNRKYTHLGRPREMTLNNKYTPPWGRQMNDDKYIPLFHGQPRLHEEAAETPINNKYTPCGETAAMSAWLAAARQRSTTHTPRLGRQLNIQHISNSVEELAS